MRLTPTREALLNIIEKRGQEHLVNLKKYLDGRKTVEKESNYTDIIEQMQFLELKKFVQYKGHSFWEVTPKGRKEMENK